jgi:hypothetical protein
LGEGSWEQGKQDGEETRAIDPDKQVSEGSYRNQTLNLIPCAQQTGKEKVKGGGGQKGGKTDVMKIR